MNKKSWKEEVEGVHAMSLKWKVSPHYLKILCQKRIVDSKKIGNTWVIYVDQPKPEINHYNWKEKD